MTNTQRALEYFDVAYAPVYGTRWPSVRLALLSKPKYIAVLNNFASYEETIERFQVSAGQLVQVPHLKKLINRIIETQIWYV